MFKWYSDNRLYDDLSTYVKTVHAHYGLQTAELPSDLVIQRSLSNNLVQERVRSVDCIIWDEMSMSSKRIFEIVNRIHHLLASGDECWKPFGRKQVVLVGEFLQLRPVPNYFDEGIPIYESELFDKCFPHRFELLTNMRQNSSEHEFLQCLKEVRVGKCTEDSQKTINNLERKLPVDLDKDAVHIFFKKIPVQLHNLKELRAMPGEFVRLDATDEGKTSSIQCPAEKTIF